MRYDDPQLRELLASRYVLGIMPQRARARFDRLIADDAAFCAEVRDWAEIFAPLDAKDGLMAPPPRVWRRIEAQLGPRPRAVSERSWLGSLWLWRGLAGLASAAAVVLAIYVGMVGVRPHAPLPSVVAVLTDKSGTPAWIVRSRTGRDAVIVRALGRLASDSAHSYELWAISGGSPRPLGILSPLPEGRLAVAVSAMPPTGGVLAVSLEPAGGSPSGLPTGPVLYQGKVFSNPL